MNVFELEAKIGLDPTEYESGIAKAKGGFKGLASGVMSGLKTVGKVTAASVTATATGVAALSKLAISGYADYEQLAGGVETLFKESSNSVMKYAQDTAQHGMSINKYMELATTSAASMLQSVGGDTEEAARLTDMAIRDMSDNANKLGSTTESLQNAYSGFAKGNFTMLDNLKIGYGGTKQEMERLLEDAEKIKASQGELVDYSIDSYADIVQAIHTVQEEMEITGTTYKEASTTISGSIGLMKAAWSNFLTGMADPSQDFGQLTQDLVSSVETVGANLIPRIKAMAPQMVEGFTQLASNALPYVSEVFTSLLPTVVEGATGLINSAVSLLPEMLSTAVSAIPSLIGAAGSILSNLGNAIAEMLPILIDTGVAMLGELTNGIEEGLPDLIARIPQIITGFVGFINENLPNILTAGYDLLIALVDGIIEGIPDLVGQLPQIISSFVEFLATNLPVIAEKGGEMLGHLAMGLIGAIPELVAQVPEIYTKICETLDQGIEAIKTIGGNFLSGLWEGISSKVEWLGEKIGGVVEKIKGWFIGGEGFDVHSPSKWAEDVFANVMAGAANGVESGSANISESAGNAFATIAARMNDIVVTIGSQWSTLTNDMGTSFQQFSESITTSDMWSSFASNMSELADSARTTMDEVVAAVEDMVAKCKAAMDFEWSLPYLKMPHITITGKFDIEAGTAPSFRVDWYRKAMDRAMILDGATIFGAMNGKYLGGGESGREIISGEDHLVNLMENAVYNVLNRLQSSGKNTSSIQIVQNIQAVPQTPVELAAATQAYFEQARWAF